MEQQFKTIKNTLRSGYHVGTKVTGDGLTLTEAIRGETGRVELEGDIGHSDFVNITFRKEYDNPVVVTYIITRSGGTQSIESRVTDVTSTGCKIFMEQPNNKIHNKEYIGYIVLEVGAHITEHGYRMEAGLHETENARRPKQTDFVGDEIKFSKIYKSTPIVLHSLNTYNNKTFATTMISEVTVDGFTVAQEFAETKKTSSKEKIGWIAFEPMIGKGYITDVRGEVGKITPTNDTGVDDKPATLIEFNTVFSNRPDVIVKGQTMNDNDGYWSRGAGAWSKELIRVYAEEDQRTDIERHHPSETFGYVAFDETSLLQSLRFYGERISDIYELVNVSIDQALITTWKTDNYSKMEVSVKYSADNGLSWSEEWIPCEYAKPVPGLPISGDLDGYFLQFKYSFNSDVSVPPHLTEFTVKYIDTPVIIEGINVGGYATNGYEWNSRRIL